MYVFSFDPPQQREPGIGEELKGNNDQVQVAELESMQALVDKRQEREWVSHYLVTEPLNTATV